jgi:hypothetical protein
MPIDIIKPFLELFEKAGKPADVAPLAPPTAPLRKNGLLPLRRRRAVLVMGLLRGLHHCRRGDLLAQTAHDHLLAGGLSTLFWGLFITRGGPGPGT